MEPPSLLMRCSENLSYVDVLFIPALERFAANMPLVRGLSLKGNPSYPRLTSYYKAMDALPSYQQVQRHRCQCMCVIRFLARSHFRFAVKTWALCNARVLPSLASSICLVLITRPDT